MKTWDVPEPHPILEAMARKRVEENRRGWHDLDKAYEFQHPPQTRVKAKR